MLRSNESKCYRTETEKKDYSGTTIITGTPVSATDGHKILKYTQTRIPTMGVYNK